MSAIEQLLLSREFSCLPPLFYNNEYALRCELGTGGAATAGQVRTAEEKARRIYRILFPEGADVLFFHREVFRPEDADRWQKRFTGSFRRKYRCAVIEGLETEDPAPEGLIRRDRILCYADGKQFGSTRLIRRLVRADFGGKGALDASFVSFENECFLSIYDDRGCDIVFASPEKYREFFPLLSEYLLDYDLEEMKRRLGG